MADSWITLAPLQNFWLLPEVLPFHFDERVSIQKIPERIIVEDSNDLLRTELIERIDNATHAIIVEYKANALDSTQQKALNEGFLALFSLWLARPTPLHISTAAHLIKDGENYITRSLGDHDPFISLPSYANEEHQIVDFEIAGNLYKKLKKLDPMNTLYSAAQATMRALWEDSGVLRFLITWVAVEALFGSASEITFRISQRIALFLKSDISERKKLFEQVKQSYSLRSRVVHGLRVANLILKKGKNKWRS